MLVTGTRLWHRGEVLHARVPFFENDPVARKFHITVPKVILGIGPSGLDEMTPGSGEPRGSVFAEEVDPIEMDTPVDG